jgi:hypothetical protein
VEEALDIITRACKRLVGDHEAFSSLAAVAGAWMQPEVSGRMEPLLVRVFLECAGQGRRLYFASASMAS